jgi:hypothetical protein
VSELRRLLRQQKPVLDCAPGTTPASLPFLCRFFAVSLPFLCRFFAVSLPFLFPKYPPTVTVIAATRARQALAAPAMPAGNE